MNSLHRLLALCALLIVAGAVIWHLCTQKPPAHGMLGGDPSSSIARHCSTLPEAALSLLRQADGVREGSQFTMLLMSTDPRIPNPDVVLGEPLPIEPTEVFGNGKAKYLKDVEQLSARITRFCETASAGTASPVYELVKQGIGHLRSLDCDAERLCHYVIQSDLEDDVHPLLRVTLHRAIKDPMVPLPAEVAGSIDNAGVTLTFCGLSQTQARRTPGPSFDARARIWKAVVTHPELVTVQPFCGTGQGK